MVFMQLRLSRFWKYTSISLLTVFGTFSIQAQQTDKVATNLLEQKTNVPVATTTNTNISTEDAFKRMVDKIRAMEIAPQKNWDEYELTTRELTREFPERSDGYDALITEMQFGNRKRAVALAEEMARSAAPRHFQIWAKGFLYRAGLFEKPVTLRFVALDGREVDLARMRGKVVLVDFWGTACAPCVAELPQIRAAYDKFHSQGFEVVGISFDSDEARLKRFINERALPWPQAFDGKQGVENKYGQEFGICAIPHLLLLDKNGRLRIDGNPYWPTIERAITDFLAEPHDSRQ